MHRFAAIILNAASKKKSYQFGLRQNKNFTSHSYHQLNISTQDMLYFIHQNCVLNTIKMKLWANLKGYIINTKCGIIMCSFYCKIFHFAILENINIIYSALVMKINLLIISCMHSSYSFTNYLDNMLDRARFST